MVQGSNFCRMLWWQDVGHETSIASFKNFIFTKRSWRITMWKVATFLKHWTPSHFLQKKSQLRFFGYWKKMPQKRFARSVLLTSPGGKSPACRSRTRTNDNVFTLLGPL